VYSGKGANISASAAFPIWAHPWGVAVFVYFFQKEKFTAFFLAEKKQI